MFFIFFYFYLIIAVACLDLFVSMMISAETTTTTKITCTGHSIFQAIDRVHNHGNEILMDLSVSMITSAETTTTNHMLGPQYLPGNWQSSQSQKWDLERFCRPSYTVRAWQYLSTVWMLWNRNTFSHWTRMRENGSSFSFNFNSLLILPHSIWEQG